MVSGMNEELRRIYRFGTLVHYPQGPIGEAAERFRRALDPVTSLAAPAHITVTQPFLEPPNDEKLERIALVLGSVSPFRLRIGPAVASPNGKMIWFDVSPAVEILEMRQAIHELGGFNTGLPYTIGFIPHLTLQETRGDRREIERVVDQINGDLMPAELIVTRLSWSAPDENFVFRERRVFELGGRSLTAPVGEPQKSYDSGFGSSRI